MALLLLNDHWFKQMAPGVVTGKLSDFAGLYVTPIACVSILELLGNREVCSDDRRAALLTWGFMSGLCFGLMQIWQPAGDAYRLLWGAMVSLPRLVGQLFQGQPTNGELLQWGVVHHTADPTDLVALPMAFVSSITGWVKRTRLFGD